MYVPAVPLNPDGSERSECSQKGQGKQKQTVLPSSFQDRLLLPLISYCLEVQGSAFVNLAFKKFNFVTLLYTVTSV